MSPWKKIWIHPKETIRWLVNHDKNRFILFFSTVSGLYFFLNFLSVLRAPGFSGSEGVRLIALLIAASPFLGMFYFWLSSHLLKLLGSWFKGSGSRLSLRCSLAWSHLPTFFLLIIFLFNQLVARLLIYEQTLQDASLPEIIASYPIWLTLNSLLTITLSVWSIVIYISGIAEVHRFGWIKATITSLIAAIFWWVVISVTVSLLATLICMFGLC